METYKSVETVVQAYTKHVNRWRQEDPRDFRRYILSKMLSDYALLEKTDLMDKEILNIGCAFPIDEICFARKIKNWISLDLIPDVLHFAQSVIDAELSPLISQRLHLMAGDATVMPFRDESFDVVVAFSTIDHVPGPEKRRQSIQEMARVSKRGGIVIITAPNRWNMAYYRRSKKQQVTGKASYGYEYCFSPKELRGMLCDAGLTPLHFASTLDLGGIETGWIGRILAICSKMSRHFGRRMGYLAVKNANRSVMALS